MPLQTYIMAVVKKANDFLYALKGQNGNDMVIEMRKEDGFINATRLCKSAGTKWNNYFRSQKTQDFLLELAGNAPERVLDFVQSEVGGRHSGTWVHPDVAVDLAKFCSPKFHVAVIRLVRRYLSGELTTEESRQVSKRFIESGINFTDYDKKHLVYLGEVDTPQFKGIKAGYTDDINRRVKEHIRDFGSFKLVKLFEALNNREIEAKVLTECSALGVKTSCKINDKMQTELITLTDGFTFANLVELVERVMNTNIPLEIKSRDRELEEKKKEIEALKSSNDLQINKEITRQLELQLELEKLKTTQQHDLETSKQELEECRKQAEELKKIEQQKCEEINTKKMDYNEKIKEIEEELARLKLEEELAIDPNEEMKAYIEKYCEFGEDGRTTKDSYRIPCSDLYDHYSKSVRLPMHYKEFKKYIQENYNVESRKCNWLYEIKLTWFGIRLKDFVHEKVSLVVKLIREFVEDECIFDLNAVTDTKILYDKFEEHAKGKGLETIKQNGFTRHLLRSQLLKLYPNIKVKEWAIEGKKHGFSGIRLNNSAPQEHKLVEEFVKICCFKGLGYRTKGKDLYKAFAEYITEKYKTKCSSMKFYRYFRAQNQDLVEKSITKSEKGFVGIVLRSVLRDA